MLALESPVMSVGSVQGTEGGGLGGAGFGLPTEGGYSLMVVTPATHRSPCREGVEFWRIYDS